MHKLTIRAVTIVGMLEPEAVAIFVFSEPLFVPNPSYLLFGSGGGAGGGTGTGAREIYIMVEGGCFVAVYHRIGGK